MIRVLVAEDQAMIRGALAALLAREHDILATPGKVEVVNLKLHRSTQSR